MYIWEKGGNLCWRWLWDTTKKLIILLIMNEANMNEINLFDYTWLYTSFFHYCFQIILPNHKHSWLALLLLINVNYYLVLLLINGKSPVIQLKDFCVEIKTEIYLKIYPWGGRLIFEKYSKMLLYCIFEMELDELFSLSQGLARE